jgi:hypothetical protein
MFNHQIGFPLQNYTHNSSGKPHKNSSPCHFLTIILPLAMDYFSKIVSSTELFSVSKFMRHVEEFYGINDNTSDMFDEFRREAICR